MKTSQETKEFARKILTEMMPFLDEKQQRKLSGLVAEKLGYGGISFVNSVTGKSRNTIASGILDSDDAMEVQDVKQTDNPCHTKSVQYNGRIRRPGGGRKQIEKRYPDLTDRIEKIICDPVISVDTKKKENIGNFKNNGSEYRPQKIHGECRIMTSRSQSSAKFLLMVSMC